MKHSFKKTLRVILTLLALTFSAVGFTPAHAASLVVNSNVDDTLANLDANSTCDLREAITNANDNATTYADCTAGNGADTITFSVSGTILLDSTLPHITDADGLTMDGTGQTVTISGKHAVQVAIVDAGASLTLNNLTIANGEYTIGSGILNSGTLIITNSAFFGNSAAVSGGGIMNQSGTLTITNSTFSGNSTSGQGGAISNSAGTLTVTNSTFTLNTASDAGGGIYAGVGTLTITNSTFSGNSAVGGLGDGLGGGIFSNGLLTITNSTFSGNSATYGGVLHISGGTAILRNTIVANSTSAGNCSGHTAGITNGGNNIDDGTTCGWGSTSGSMSSTGPLLGALANNGGLTQTFALLTGSPALNAGNDTVCNADPVNRLDQRGIARPQGAHCDIGSYEFVDTTPPDTTIDSYPSDPSNDNTPPFAFSGSDGTGSGIASFMCRMDGGGYSACTTPFTSPALMNGSHTFYVYAIDNTGNADASPASFTWQVMRLYRIYLPLIMH